MIQKRETKVDFKINKKNIYKLVYRGLLKV